jgi:hypothetical protein
MTAGLSVTSTRAFAAPDSGLRHACHYRYGVGDYQDVSYSGATTCNEARALIAFFTDDGKRRPKHGVRKAYTPHGIWRCTTVRRREAHGVIYSTHRIACSLRHRPEYSARIRFFYEY